MLCWGLIASLSLLSSLAGAAPWCCPWHCTFPEPSGPGRALSNEGGTGCALAGAGAQALALCIPGTHLGLLSIRDTFPLFVPTCHQCHQCSTPTGTWGHFVTSVPHWDPLKLQETFKFQSVFEFLRSFLNTLSGTESDANSTKALRGSLQSLCCVSAAKLGQALGTEAAPGNQEELQKHISLDEQIFSQPSRAGALPTATLGTAQGHRELQSVRAGKMLRSDWGRITPSP